MRLEKSHGRLHVSYWLINIFRCGSLDTPLYLGHRRAILCANSTFYTVLTEGRGFEQYGEKFTPLAGHCGCIAVCVQ